MCEHACVRVYTVCTCELTSQGNTVENKCDCSHYNKAIDNVDQ